MAACAPAQHLTAVSVQGGPSSSSHLSSLQVNDLPCVTRVRTACQCIVWHQAAWQTAAAAGLAGCS